jgi:hypothetical protein
MSVIVPLGWPVRLGRQRFLSIVLVVGGFVGRGGFADINVGFLSGVGVFISILRRSS